MADGAKKEKIAILGGGIGALATAFEITEEEGWEEKYDLTVYQMGWRLGGKGASGRNMAPEYASRVEEHGIHVWGGYYQNAFRVMRVCYDYLNKHNIRQPDAPLGTYRKAFSPLANIGLVEDKYLELKDEKYKEPEKRWVNWVFAPPTEKENGEYDFPGKSDATVSIWTSITTVLDVMRERLKEAVGQRFQLGMFLLSLAYRLVK
ncbi:MAG: NAD(P)-binding protein, partial [Candidatus Latescibacteria bacterium]|nr:NAD(P)-binding protein [Candidatus Latescibacterota bacterium]